jgi:transposase
MKKQSNRRDLEKERHWQDLVRQQDQSGLSVRAFCRREGVKESAFFWWRRELPHRRGKCPSAPGQEAVRFLPVQMTSDRKAEDGGIEIQCNGSRILVRPGFDRQTLSDVLAVLETARC